MIFYNNTLHINWYFAISFSPNSNLQICHLGRLHTRAKLGPRFVDIFLLLLNLLLLKPWMSGSKETDIKNILCFIILCLGTEFLSLRSLTHRAQSYTPPTERY